MAENQHNELITVTAEELMDRQFLPRHSVIDHFLPTGTFILSGQPKIGKSFLMLKRSSDGPHPKLDAAHCSSL